MLQHDLNSLQIFPNFVLYSSNGIRHALKAQKSLATLIPKDKFLIAYLQLNTHGKIANAHLLIDDPQSNFAAGEKNLALNMKHVAQDDDIRMNFELNPDKQINDAQEIDQEYPLFLQVSAIANFRQAILRPIADEMIELINKQTEEAQPEFTARFAKLVQKYQEADKDSENP